MKYKHNKRKNTAFLYEVLILELSKSVFSKNKILRSKILETIKSHFKKDNLLFKELRLYRTILNTKNIDNNTAERIIQESKIEYEKLDKNKLLDEQSKLFFAIKKILASEPLSNFVPNYKDLASISQIFNKDVSIKTRIILENELRDKMSSQLLKEEKMIPIDNLVLNSFVKNFNQKYNDILLKEQKELLNKYIKSFSDNALELKIFLNEEIKRLKFEIKESLKLKEFTENENMISNMNDVLIMLEGYSKKEINQEMVNQILKIQNLIQEIKS